MNKTFLLFTILLSLVFDGSVGVCSDSGAKQFNVIFSTCTEATTEELSAFAAQTNQYLSVSHLTVALECSQEVHLESSVHFFVISLVEREDGLYLSVRLPASVSTMEQERERKIPWESTALGFVTQTVLLEETKTLALLVDNMMLDFVGISLDVVPDKILEVADEKEETAQVVPMAAKCDYESVCDAKRESDKSEVIVKAPIREEKVTVLTRKSFGVSGGVNYFTQRSFAPRFVADVGLHFGHIVALVMGDFETDSTFKIGRRVFDTSSSSWGMGVRVQREKSRSLLGLESFVRVRYFSTKRTDVEDAKWHSWADIGVGVYLFAGFQFNKVAGMFVRTGIEAYPKARVIIVEDGPKEKLGLFGFPTMAGFFAHF